MQVFYCNLLKSYKLVLLTTLVKNIFNYYFYTYLQLAKDKALLITNSSEFNLNNIWKLVPINYILTILEGELNDINVYKKILYYNLRYRGKLQLPRFINFFLNPKSCLLRLF